MGTNPASKPTERMKALYWHFSDKWGEPEYLIWFDPAKAAIPGKLERIQIGVWPSDEECEVNTFISFGMSELEMAGNISCSRAEFQFAVRGELSSTQIHEGAKYLANLAEYPFSNALGLDWWHRIKNAGAVPFFGGARRLLLRPPFSDSQCGDCTFDGDKIKFLFVVPLYENENDIIDSGGVNAYIDYLCDNELDPLGHR